MPISAHHFDGQENERRNEPFPVVGAVNDEQNVVDNIEAMCPVKDLFVVVKRLKIQ